MKNTITPYEVGRLLSEAQERINDSLSCADELTPADYEEITRWRDDVEKIFAILVDEMSWVADGKHMLTNH
jgi:hypothetical protein